MTQYALLKNDDLKQMVFWYCASLFSGCVNSCQQQLTAVSFHTTKIFFLPNEILNTAIAKPSQSLIIAFRGSSGNSCV